jgi:hypothetical protein
MGRGMAGADLGVEGAGGVGHLAQQLLAAEDQVVDVQPKLGRSTGSGPRSDPAIH